MNNNSNFFGPTEQSGSTSAHEQHAHSRTPIVQCFHFHPVRLIMSEKKRFESGASKRKKQQEKMLKHEELLSKCPKLFDFGFKCNAAPAVEQQTEQTKDASQPSDFDGNMKEAEALEVEVVPCDTNVTRVDDDEQPELVHLKKEDLESEFQDDIGLWSTSNTTEEVRDFWCKQGHVECQHHDDDFSSSVRQYPDQKRKMNMRGYL